MTPLSEEIQEYRKLLKAGRIQKAYRGIHSFMTGLMSYLEKNHMDHTVSMLYMGYMDMSYFAFTPQGLKEKKLKVAIVYLHEEGRFEAWLSGMNRKIQAEYISKLKNRNVNPYDLSSPGPGVDSILTTVLTDNPDFDAPERTYLKLENSLIHFTEEVTSILNLMTKEG